VIHHNNILAVLDIGQQQKKPRRRRKAWL